jgi:hypothetical protein
MKMPKLTIDNKDYYTDDFNKEQMSAYNEMTSARSEMQRMDYLMRLLDERTKALASFIITEANKQEEPDETKTSE